MSKFKVRLNVRFVGCDEPDDRIKAAERVLDFVAEVDESADLATTSDPETFAFYTTVTTADDDRLFTAAEEASERVRKAGEDAGFSINRWPKQDEVPWGMFYKSIEVDLVESATLVPSS